MKQRASSPVPQQDDKRFGKSIYGCFSVVEGSQSSEGTYFCAESRHRGSDLLSLGLLEGFGPRGPRVASLACEELGHLMTSFFSNKGITEDNIKMAFAEAEASLLHRSSDAASSGCSALVVLKHQDTVYAASCGASRCLVGSVDATGKVKARVLGTEHTIEVPDEAARIRAAGALLQPVPHGLAGEERLVVCSGREALPSRSLSRCLGFRSGKSSGLVSTPSLTVDRIGPEDRYLLLLPQVVTQFLPNYEILLMAHKLTVAGMGPAYIAKKVVEESLRRGHLLSEEPPSDATVLFSFLNPRAWRMMAGSPQIGLQTTQCADVSAQPGPLLTRSRPQVSWGPRPPPSSAGSRADSRTVGLLNATTANAMDTGKRKDDDDARGIRGFLRRLGRRHPIISAEPPATALASQPSGSIHSPISAAQRLAGGAIQYPLRGKESSSGRQSQGYQSASGTPGRCSQEGSLGTRTGGLPGGMAAAQAQAQAQIQGQDLSRRRRVTINEEGSVAHSSQTQSMPSAESVARSQIYLASQQSGSGAGGLRQQPSSRSVSTAGLAAQPDTSQTYHASLDSSRPRRPSGRLNPSSKISSEPIANLRGGQQEGSPTTPTAGFGGRNRAIVVPLSEPPLPTKELRHSCEGDLLTLGLLEGFGPYATRFTSTASDELTISLSAVLKSQQVTETAVVEAFKEAEDNLLHRHDIDTLSTGCSALVVLKHQDTVYVVSCGASRCLVGSVDATGKVKARGLGTEHTVDVPDEAARIRAAGALLQPVPHGLAGEERLVVCSGRDALPSRSLSRCLGFRSGKSSGLVSTPSLTVDRIGPEDRYLLLLPQVVTLYFSNTEIVSSVHKHVEAGRSSLEISSKLLEEAQLRGEFLANAPPTDGAAVVALLHPAAWSPGHMHGPAASSPATPPLSAANSGVPSFEPATRRPRVSWAPSLVMDSQAPDQASPLATANHHMPRSTDSSTKRSSKDGKLSNPGASAGSEPAKGFLSGIKGFLRKVRGKGIYTVKESESASGYSGAAGPGAVAGNQVAPLGAGAAAAFFNVSWELEEEAGAGPAGVGSPKKRSGTRSGSSHRPNTSGGQTPVQGRTNRRISAENIGMAQPPGSGAAADWGRARPGRGAANQAGRRTSLTSQQALARAQLYQGSGGSGPTAVAPAATGRGSLDSNASKRAASLGIAVRARSGEHDRCRASLNGSAVMSPKGPGDAKSGGASSGNMTGYQFNIALPSNVRTTRAAGDLDPFSRPRSSSPVPSPHSGYLGSPPAGGRHGAAVAANVPAPSGGSSVNRGARSRTSING